MKKVLLVLAVLGSYASYAQKRITFEEMKTFTKGAFENAFFDEYTAADGHIYKIGDTLKLGRPSSNKTFAFIDESFGASPEAAKASVSGTNSIIKRIYVFGTKKMGFKIYFIGKGITAMSAPYHINVEEAIAVGELKSFGMSRDEAIAKLKEQKDLLDLGMITKEQFDRLKLELTPIIMK